MKEKISIVTDEISQDLDEVTRFLDEHDIRAIEIRTMGGKRVPDIDWKIWDELKKRVKSEGWKVIALSPGTFKGYCSNLERSCIEVGIRLPAAVDLAVEIGAESVITFGFMMEENPDNSSSPLGFLFQAAMICLDKGAVPLLLENEPGSFAQSGEGTREFMDIISHPNLFSNWDPCNSNVFDNPESLANGARALGDKIKHVHVKDGAPVKDSIFPAYGPISAGHLGWKEHLKVLKEIGYNGYLGIETHYEPLVESSAVMVRELRELTKEIDFWGDD